MTSMTGKIIAISFLFLASLTHAHLSGHGPKQKGKGPKGGAWVSVVSAKEADLGTKAKAVATAEFIHIKPLVKESASRFAFYIYDTNKKQIPIGAQFSKVKWIVFLPKVEKPLVLETSLTDEETQTELMLQSAVKPKGIEAILYPRDEKAEKWVAASFL